LMLQIPELTTERLLLRCFKPDDFEAYAEMMADPDVTRHLGLGKPLSRADAWRQMAMLIGHWALRGYGVWAVEERATGRFLGRIGCMHQEGFPAFEIAYTLGPWAWSKGYAREGAAAALRFAREVIQYPEITSIIRPANAASIRVATSLGAVPGETVEFFGAPSVLYRYPKA
ncbi:MAG TPA: GNAT family N-acetyltransferase, partial [Gemmatimonadaceae bacterium]|nr:GNAT family N-acetyltransferase [Gemmatimonadaceae bacterium]